MSSLLLSTLTAVAVAGVRPILNIESYGASSLPGDDSAAINLALQDARDRGGAIVYVPTGTYEATNLRIYGNTELSGDGPASVIRAPAGGSGYMLSINPGYAGWGDNSIHDPSKNVKNIIVRKLRFEDRSVEDGMDTTDHLLNFNGCSFVLVEDCEIAAFRGDGLYLGSGNISGIERHNEDITVRRCLFDGVNGKNRNAITLIDGTRVSITDCTVVNTTLGTGPGQMDIEPNKNLFHRVRDVKIEHNTFTGNGGRAAITMDVPFNQTQLYTPIQNISIRYNKIDTSQPNGIIIYQVDSPGPLTPHAGIDVGWNEIRNVTVPIAIEGISGARIHNNQSYDTGNGYALGYGPLGRGIYDVSVFDNLIVRAGRNSNNYAGSAFAVMNANKLDIIRNKVIDIYRPDNLVGCLAMLRGGQNGGATVSLNVSGNEMGWTGKTVASPVWVKVLFPHVTDPTTQVVANNVTFDVPASP